MMRATLNQLDYLVNHPKIQPSTGMAPDQMGSMAAFFDNPRNVALINVCGGMLFNHIEGNEFSGHFLFIPGYSGKLIKETAKAMLIEMFTNYDASVIKGYPPRDNRAVRVIGTALGYKKIDNATFEDDFGRLCETYEVRQKWLV